MFYENAFNSHGIRTSIRHIPTMFFSKNISTNKNTITSSFEFNKRISQQEMKKITETQKELPYIHAIRINIFQIFYSYVLVNKKTVENIVVIISTTML